MNNLDKYANLPILAVASELGIEIDHRYNAYAMAKAPWRSNERHGSIKLNLVANRWIDFGDRSRCGTAIELVMNALGKSLNEAVRWLHEHFFDVEEADDMPLSSVEVVAAPTSCVTPTPSAAADAEGDGVEAADTVRDKPERVPALTLVSVSTLLDPEGRCLRPLAKKRIPVAVAARYLRFITYRNRDGRETGCLAIPNINGGYNTLSRHMPLVIGRNGISYFSGRRANVCLVFVSALDLLAYSTENGVPEEDVIILNGDVFADEAAARLGRYDNVLGFFTKNERLAETRATIRAASRSFCDASEYLMRGEAASYYDWFLARLSPEEGSVIGTLLAQADPTKNPAYL